MENIMENDELVNYKLDIEILKREGYITDDMSNDQKYKMIRLNQQWNMVEDGMTNLKKRDYMRENPDNFDYGLLGKEVYFCHCGIVGQGYVMAISRWYDRMYRIHSNKFEKPSSVHYSDIFTKLDDLFNHLNSKNELEEN
jgi:hypothetical protein